LGTALTRRLIEHDYRLALTYLLPEEASRFEEEFDVSEDKLTLTRVDATNTEAVAKFMKDVAEKNDGIHGLCALVGGWAGGRDVEETDDVRFERMLDLNLRSAF
jgi:NAD(P)-dependent dehydrogenase (short-subunit alcohol dehydrogenase family)